MRLLKGKLLIFSALFLVFGIICLLLENSFYQYLDEDAYLHESLLLPVGVLCCLSGGLGMVVAVVLNLLKKNKGR